METYLLLAIAILLPVLCAGLCSIIRGRNGRSIIVTAAALVMSVVAILLVGKIMAAGGRLALGLESPVDFNLIVEILDIALIVYIIYIGFSLKKILISALAAIQLIAVLVFEIFGSVKEPEKVFVLDYLSLIMVLLVSIVGPLVAVFALGYMHEHEEHQHVKKSRQPRFFLIIFIFLGAMNGLVVTNNLMWMGFFWEVTTVCSFLLISHDKTEEAVRNGVRALWINLVGGIAFVLGTIMIYNVTGTLAIDEIVSARPGAAFAGFLPIGLGMLCLAGFTKSAQFPFQSWLLGAMVAPTPVSGLLHSSTMVKAGVYLVVRFAPAFAGTILGTIVAIVGGFTFVVGSALAISQRNAKRVLAYSTIANLGLIICCAGIGTNIALGAAMLLIVFHAISKGLLFLCVGTIEHGIGSRDIEDMQGLMKKMPFTTVITVIGMISMLLPPFGVLMTKWLSIEAAVHLPIVLVLIILGSAFTVFFWAKWIGIILTMSYKTSLHVEKLRASVKTALTILTLFVLSASILIVPLFNTFIAPQLSMDSLGDTTTLTSGNGGIWLGNGNVLHMGGFASIGFFIVLFAIVLTIPIFIRRTRPEKIKPPYMGGENVNDDIRGIEFMGPADKVESVIVHNYYFKNLLGEERLTLVVNLIAGAIILIMFGVVI